MSDGDKVKCLWRDLPCVCGGDKPCGNLAAERGEPVDVVAAPSASRAEVERLSRVEAAACSNFNEHERMALLGPVAGREIHQMLAELAAKIIHGLGPDGRPVGLDMAAKEKAAEETLACQLGGKVKP
jgi:hypothetical protein